MTKYILKRLAISVATLFLMMIILFLLLELMPGSPFNDQKLDEVQKAVLMAKYGLDRPVWERLIRYIANVCRGDFGVSYMMAKDVPVSELLMGRIGVSLRIGFLSLLWGTLIGLVIGVVSALWQGKAVDKIGMTISVLGLAVPAYVFAVLFCYFLGYQWRLFPLIYDMRRPVYSASLPVIASAVMIVSVIARFSRDEMIRVMQSDYVLFARCQGISRNTIIVRYILRNAMLPIATVMGSLIISLLTGTLVIEDIFAVPGIGSFMGLSIAYNDYNVILALSFVYSTIYVVVMLVVDLIYGLLDPRIRING